MSSINQALVDEFKAKAGTVNAVVQEVPDLDAALQYVVDVCAAKSPCELLADEPGFVRMNPADAQARGIKNGDIVSAPCLDEEHFARLSAACEAKGFLCLKDGLRSRLAGIDVGFSMADFGVAASATCVVNTDSEEGRLAGMISEVSVIALKKSEIYPHLPAIAGKMRERMGTGSTPTYTTFITGPSRTADIERVSAIGVHGPLELHIVLLEA